MNVELPLLALPKVGNGSTASAAWQGENRRPIRQLVGRHGHLDEARETITRLAGYLSFSWRPCFRGTYL